MLVQILSVPTCQVCDITVGTLTQLSGEYPVVSVERLNIADWPQLAERYGLLSFEYDLLATHAVVIDGKLAGVGHPSRDRLRRWLDDAGTEEDSFAGEGVRVDPPED